MDNHQRSICPSKKCGGRINKFYAVGDSLNKYFRQWRGSLTKIQAVEGKIKKIAASGWRIQ